jgi:hypothetical protein
MSCTSFNIEADSKWNRSHFCSSDKASENSFSLIVVWSKDEAAFGNRIRRFISKAGSSAKIVNCDSSPIPLAENSCWVISRDEFRVGGAVESCADDSVEHGASPFGDSPPACESPHTRVTNCNNDVRLDKSNLLFEQVESSRHAEIDEHISERDKLTWIDAGGEPAFVLLGELAGEFGALPEEERDVVLGWALVAEVSDETFAAGDARLVEHPVEFLTGSAHEWDELALLVSAGSLADDHHSGGDGAVGRNLDAHQCLYPNVTVAVIASALSQ